MNDPIPRSSVDAEMTEFATNFKRFLEAMTVAAEAGGKELTELGALVEEFLGVPLSDVDPVTESFPTHQAVDLDVALEAVLTDLGGRLIGVSGPMRHGVESFPEFLQRTEWNFRPGAVSYARIPTGPDTDRRVVYCGLGLLSFGGTPVVWLQRGASPQYGRDCYTLELMSPKLEVVEQLLQRVQTSMATNSCRSQ